MDKQANRISKLNELCRKVSNDVHQIKKECREGNYDIDPVFDPDIKKVYSSAENLNISDQPNPQAMMLSPLEAVT